jgi:hypothetical protein
MKSKNRSSKLHKKIGSAYLWMVLILICLPFLVQREFYPFLYFAMFANETLEKETFVVECRGKVFTGESLYLDPSTFEALCKKYYHQNQCSWFLQKLDSGPCTLTRTFGTDTTQCSN